MHRDVFYCMKLILTQIMRTNNAKLKKTTQMIKLSPKMPVRSYTFAHNYHDSGQVCCIQNSFMQ